jgi:hypothetical protein
MMTMAADAIHVPETLQTLIDSRLDTIDRMLLGRMPRGERLEIVREVESQIFELLQSRCGGEPTREDILAVLGRLDPPEAYLPEAPMRAIGAEAQPSPASVPYTARSARPGLPARRRDPRETAGWASGILGLVCLAALLLLPVGWLSALLTETEIPLIILWFGAVLFMFMGGCVSLVLCIYARLTGAWSVVGLVTSLFSILISLAAGGFLLLDLL